MEKTTKPNRTLRVMLYGALCVALSFALSYIKLFPMPMGGSVTLCSMLPNRIPIRFVCEGLLLKNSMV